MAGPTTMTNRKKGCAQTWDACQAQAVKRLNRLVLGGNPPLAVHNPKNNPMLPITALAIKQVATVGNYSHGEIFPCAECFRPIPA